MNIKLKQTLKGANTAIGIYNLANFTWKVISGVLHWYHNHQLHHTIELNEAQLRHHEAGGKLECEYACGTVLRT